MTDHAELVREARERAEKATPGPWEVQPKGEIGDSGMTAWMVTAGEDNAAAFFTVEGFDDIDFIAHARADIPALCDAVEELGAALPNPCIDCLVDIQGEHDCSTASPHAAAVAARLRRIEEAAKAFAGQPGVRLSPPFEQAWLALRTALEGPSDQKEEA